MAYIRKESNKECIYIPIADLLCNPPETNNIVNQLYFNKNFQKLKKKERKSFLGPSFFKVDKEPF